MNYQSALAPRRPFAAVPAFDLVRDAITAATLLLGLSLPWTFEQTRGSMRIEILLATVAALAALALPYAVRAGFGGYRLAENERWARLGGAFLLVAVGLVYLVIDIIPGGEMGIGIGLGLSLAGAFLLAMPTAAANWRFTLLAVGLVVAAFAIITPIVAITDNYFTGWDVAKIAIAAVAALVFLWFTLWRFDAGDIASGVLLVGVGAVVALGGVLVGGHELAPWLESVEGWWLGLVLWPVLAAAAAPRVFAQVGTDPQPMLWINAAARGMALVAGLGAVITLLALIDEIANSGEHAWLRMVMGLAIGGAGFIGWQTLEQKPTEGRMLVYIATGATTLLGLVLMILRGGISGQVDSIEFLAVGLPTVVFLLLLVPRSVKTLYPVSVTISEVTTGEPIPRVEVAATTQQPVDPKAKPVITAAPTEQVAPVPDAVPSEAPTQEAEPVAEEGAEKLADDGSVKAKGAREWTVEQASNPKTPLADLAKIAAEAPHLRSQVAANPSTYSALLDWLGALGDPDVDTALRSRE
ncbi:MAG: hypothetical protein FWD83_05035 [Promicromonosporaceae bacterium]|nr:hypothetical protein [Promicromonosporaceae bacterium]